MLEPAEMSLSVLPPYPWIESTEALRDGAVLPTLEVCKSCRDKTCAGAYSNRAALRDVDNGLAVGTCGKSVDFVRWTHDGEIIVLCGLLVDFPGEDRPRKLKKQYATHAIRVDAVKAWAAREVARAIEAERQVEEGVRSALEMFHDVQTVASTIVRSAERLQSTQEGMTPEARFAALPPAAQTLVKAAQLLELRVRTMPIVSNPAAAQYGSRSRKPIYKIVDSLARIFQTKASEKSVSVRLNGESHRLVNVYDSFDLLPLTLIENAVKYSAANQVVDVEVQDTDAGVRVSVSSFSPWIPVAERQAIFERRFRASTAMRLNQVGSGLGLFIAESVARAHNTHVLFATDDSDALISGVRYANNRFYFVVRDTTSSRASP